MESSVTPHISRHESGKKIGWPPSSPPSWKYSLSHTHTDSGPILHLLLDSSWQNTPSHKMTFIYNSKWPNLWADKNTISSHSCSAEDDNDGDSKIGRETLNITEQLIYDPAFLSEKSKKKREDLNSGEQQIWLPGQWFALAGTGSWWGGTSPSVPVGTLVI